MSCPEHELLSAYADGELESSMLAETERHLAGCASCREFVQEMRWVDTYGQSSLRAIRATAGPDPITLFKTAERPRRLRPIALAAAAIVLVSLFTASWFVASRLRGLQPSPSRFASAETKPRLDSPTAAALTDPISTARPRPSSDEAFERWVEPYRKLRIPLVPMEELANYKPGEIPPTPDPATKPPEKN